MRAGLIESIHLQRAGLAEERRTALQIAVKLGVSVASVKKVLRPLAPGGGPRLYSLNEAFRRRARILEEEEASRQSGKKRTFRFHNCDVEYTVHERAGQRFFSKHVIHKKCSVEARGSRVFVRGDGLDVEKRTYGSTLVVRCHAIRDEETRDFVKEGIYHSLLRAKSDRLSSQRADEVPIHHKEEIWSVLMLSKPLFRRLVNEEPDLLRMTKEIDGWHRNKMAFFKCEDEALIKEFKKIIGRKRKIAIGISTSLSPYTADLNTVDRKEAVALFSRFSSRAQKTFLADAQTAGGDRFVCIGLNDPFTGYWIPVSGGEG